MKTSLFSLAHGMRKMFRNRMLLGTILAVVLLGFVSLGTFAWKFTAGLRPPVRVAEPDYWPTMGWRTSTPEEQGFDSARLAQGLRTLQEKGVDIDSLMIIRNGYVVLNARFDPYDGTFPHDQASVTKSVMTTLIGIAVDQGKLDLDAPVVSFFPDRTIANLDERKARMTVRHLVSMVNGMESGCHDGDQPTVEKMMANPDWVQAALDRPMQAEPGREFCYDSPGMHLLSAILQEVTGMTALDFARQNLFEPLGIQQAIWEVDPQGYSRGWGDLHLLPEDAVKIGYLWLHRGSWDGQKLVSEAWVLDSVRPHSKFIEPDFGYGCGWWVAWGDYQAAGRGGQRIRVMASINTIVATTGSNFEYDEVEEWLVPMLINLKDRLPSNPEGVDSLEMALQAVAEPSSQRTGHPISKTAQVISGKTYTCEKNLAGIQSLRMVFDDPQQATLFVQSSNGESIWPVGLDGSFRQAFDGTGMRGYWEDDHMFQIENFDIGLLYNQVNFEGDHLQFTIPEYGLEVACQQKDL